MWCKFGQVARKVLMQRNPRITWSPHSRGGAPPPRMKSLVLNVSFSERALSEHLKFTVRRHKFNQDSLCSPFPPQKKKIQWGRFSQLTIAERSWAWVVRRGFGAGGSALHPNVGTHPTSRCRLNLAHTRQSRPDSGLGFQVG